MMSKTYTITSSQVTQIHNAWVDLNAAYLQASEQFKTDSHLVKSLDRALKALSPVRDDVVRRKDKDWDKQYKKAERVKKFYGFKNSIWSIYEIESFDDTSSVPSGSKLISYYSGRDISVSVEGPTWLDLWKATDKLIGLTRDIHGDLVFIEQYFKSKTDNFYEVSLGS